MTRPIAKRVGWSLLGTAVLGLILGGLVQIQRPYRTSFNGSAHDAGTGGGRALWLWAGRMGWPLAFNTETLPALPELPRRAGNCILSLGNNALSEKTDADWTALRGWLARGNSLILVTSDPGSLPEALFQQVLGLGTPGGTGGDRDFSGHDGSDDHLDQLTLAEGTRLTINASGPRWSGLPKSWETAGDSHGSVYHRVRVGAGAVVILLDDFALSNNGLDAASNPEAVAALLSRELAGGTLVMDEARHGYGQVNSFLSVLLALPGARPAALLGCLLVALFFYGQNVRLGPPQPYRPRERRSAREYIDALAELHQRARAAPLMVEAVARRVHGLARRRAKVGIDLNDILARAAEYRRQAPRERQPLQALKLLRELTHMRGMIIGSK